LVILGIDPATINVGWGIVEFNGSRCAPLASGVIKVKGAVLSARLLRMANEMDKIIQQFQPDVGVVEKIFHAKNASSALKLGHARGALILSLSRGGMDVVEYAATEVKKGLTGYGRATKEQVQHMVSMLLGIREYSTFDESDALSMALFHGQRSATPSGRMLQALHLQSKR